MFSQGHLHLNTQWCLRLFFFFMHDQMGCFMSNLSSYTSDIQKNTSMILVQWLIFTSSFRVYRKIKTKYFYQWKYGIQHIHVCTIFFICCLWKPDVTATCIRQDVFSQRYRRCFIDVHYDSLTFSKLLLRKITRPH